MHASILSTDSEHWRRSAKKDLKVVRRDTFCFHDLQFMKHLSVVAGLYAGFPNETTSITLAGAMDIDWQAFGSHSFHKTRCMCSQTNYQIVIRIRTKCPKSSKTEMKQILVASFSNSPKTASFLAAGRHGPGQSF